MGASGDLAPLAHIALCRIESPNGEITLNDRESMMIRLKKQKVRNLEQLSDNIGATGWFLTAKQIDDINQASRLEVTYPYDQRSEDQQRAGREL